MAKGVEHQRKGGEKSQCYSKMTPIVLLSPTLSFLFGGEDGKRGKIISVRFGEQMWLGNSEGALFWLCLAMFDQKNIGP